MKNIHLIPTDKPSRLYKDDNQVLNLHTHSVLKGVFTNGIGSNQHIYITFDDEIKEGDWFFRDGSIHKCFRVHRTDIEFLTSIDSVYCGSNTFWSKEFCQKIILTTDQDLIKDGVQAIDDEFLEWFVNNPSCERVEVSIMNKGYNKTEDIPYQEFYKIIIPKEEPNKTHYLDELPNMDKKVLAKMWESAIPKLESKQETLEEAAEKYHNKISKKRNTQLGIPSEDFIAGAKWQAEKMYSEEDMKQFGLYLGDNLKKLKNKSIDEIFEHFKNL